MLIIACLIWIGITLNAPAWFYILLGLCAMYKLVKFGMDLANK